MDPPAIDGSAMQEAFWSHDPVALKDKAVFHYKAHVAQCFDVVQRIALDGDHIGWKAHFDQSALVVDVADPVTVRSHDLEDFFVGNVGSLPALEKIDHHLAACHARDVVVRVGG